MSTRRGPFLALAAAAIVLASSVGADAQVAASLIPRLEAVQSGLIDRIDHLHLTHSQHEQVERIIADEAAQLWLLRGNPNLSVAKIFTEEQAIRVAARRQIVALLTAKQVEKLTKMMIHEIEEGQRWGHDQTGFFSIPSIY